MEIRKMLIKGKFIGDKKINQQGTRKRNCKIYQDVQTSIPFAEKVTEYNFKIFHLFQFSQVIHTAASPPDCGSPLSRFVQK